jgi:tetratricopeptide (TPR) repeat protein
MARILFLLLITVLSSIYKATDLMSNFNQIAISYNDQAVRQIGARNLDSALVLINRSLSVDSNSEVAYSNKVTIYFLMKDFKNALITAEKGLLLDPDDAELYVTAGAICEILTDSTMAFDYYRKGIKTYDKRISHPNPNDPIGLSKNRFNRACLLLYCGKEKEGKLELKKLKADKHNIEDFDEFLKVDRQEYLKCIGIKKNAP